MVFSLDFSFRATIYYFFQACLHLRICLKLPSLLYFSEFFLLPWRVPLPAIFQGGFLATKSKTAKTLFFKQKYIERTRKYFEKYGSRTLIIARFLPIVRTFAPILAGLVKMNFLRFTLYNLIGGFIWVLSLVGSGYFWG